MATITIIPSVRLYRTGVKTTQADGSIKSIALHQGSLDGHALFIVQSSL